jgi:hypothetical protein
MYREGKKTTYFLNIFEMCRRFSYETTQSRKKGEGECLIFSNQ